MLLFGAVLRERVTIDPADQNSGCLRRQFLFNSNWEVSTATSSKTKTRLMKLEHVSEVFDSMTENGSMRMDWWCLAIIAEEDYVCKRSFGLIQHGYQARLEAVVGFLPVRCPIVLAFFKTNINVEGAALIEVASRYRFRI